MLNVFSCFKKRHNKQTSSEQAEGGYMKEIRMYVHLKQNPSQGSEKNEQWCLGAGMAEDGERRIERSGLKTSCEFVRRNQPGCSIEDMMHPSTLT